MKFLTALLCVSFALVQAEKLTFENYKVYNLIPKTEKDVQLLTDLRKDDSYSFWTDIVNVDKDVRIMVSPEKQEDFLKYTEGVGFKPVVTIEDVQKTIDAQLRTAEMNGRNSGSFSWNRYHTLDEIYAWLDELAVQYPDIVTVVVLGQSNEGRELKGVIIDHKPNDRGDRPLTGMIEGGIHAREWISPATVTWIINEFLNSNDPSTRTLAETFVWHIFPSINPDGYVYTFTNNRMWRKNRNVNHATNCPNNNDLSNGVDLNRNFDFSWMGVGASNNPCTETFAGSSGASEPETRAVSNYVLSLRDSTNFVYYFAFHSYTQLVLVPYSHVVGFDKLQVPNYADMYEVAIRGADALQSVHGTSYTVGVSSEILYGTSGSSFDWVRGVADVPMSFLFELRDMGEYGFLLPPEQIIPNNEEIMACLLEMDRSTRNLGYYDSGSSAIIGSFALLISAAAVLLYSS